MTDKPKAIAYVRVSKFSQVERDAIQNQVMEVNRLAEYKGYEIVKWFEDPGVSGRRDDRPGLNAAMEYLRNNRGTVTVFLAAKIDRVGRSNIHLAKLVEEMMGMKDKFITSDLDVDLDTAAGQLTFDILSAMAKFEVMRMTERIRAGLERVKSQGKKLGRKKKKISRNELEKMVNNRASIAYMARSLKVSPSTVIARLNEYGLRNGKLLSSGNV